MKISQNFGFHAILNKPLIGYIAFAKIIIEEKIPFLQLRAKELTENEIYNISQEIMKLKEGTNTKFIIHDNPKLALKIGADGLHLSQKIIAYPEARKIVGPNMLIGLSCLKLKHVITANKLQPDYIGIGPIYFTPGNPDSPIGIQGLKNFLAKNTLPVLAIGGIDTANMLDIKNAGAKNICIIREINDSDNPKKILKAIKEIYSW